MACPVRKYPLTQPKGWQPPVPRWTLVLPDHVQHIYTTYIGVQSHGAGSTGSTNTAKALEAVRDWLDQTVDRPDVVDPFSVMDGHDVSNSHVWVCYWTEKSCWERSLARLRLVDIHAELGEERSSVGLWCEYFVTPVERLETNYSSLEHAPGMADLANTKMLPHNLTAYWGAARDRMPASAYDQFEVASDSTPPENIPSGLGERLVGSNYENMVHIRSGQWWTNCDAEEREAYESTLQPTLMNGMSYLWDNPLKTGTLGLRFLRNLDASGNPIKETCGAGFFRNLNDLEQWAKRHPSHLAIFNGAHKHAKEFGPDRKFMTWHEVSVLKRGEAHFEYINCVPGTGVIKYVELESQPL